MTKGRIHSIETMSGVDGPGVRCVVFLQGCPLRCLYCQNPDTWPISGGEEMTPQELFEKVSRYKSYFGETGGVTLTGGEPLLQAEFVTEFFTLCRQNSIHTALDTSGVILTAEAKTALEFTSLVLLDLKHIDEEKFRELTGGELSRVLRFMCYLHDKMIPMWVRQVIVPGWNDSSQELAIFAELLGDYDNIERVELLGYHKLADEKYRQLGIEPPLPGVPEMDAAKLAAMQNELDEKLGLTRRN